MLPEWFCSRKRLKRDLERAAWRRPNNIVVSCNLCFKLLDKCLGSIKWCRIKLDCRRLRRSPSRNLAPLAVNKCTSCGSAAPSTAVKLKKAILLWLTLSLNSQKTQTAAVIIIFRDISVNEPHSRWQASFPDRSESLLTSIRGKIRMQRYVTNTAFFWLLYKLYSKRSSEFL